MASNLLKDLRGKIGTNCADLQPAGNVMTRIFFTFTLLSGLNVKNLQALNLKNRVD